MTLLLLYFSLLFTCLKSLKVFKNDFSNSHKTYDHNTANFGPDEGTYNVSGPFKLMSPLQGCSIDKYAYNKTIILSNGESMTTTSYYQIYNNSIVLIKRGNCTFSDKVYYSSLLGAIGVVIGDNKNSDEWIAMEKSDDRDIKIPSVFIPHSEFNTLYKLFENVTNSIPTIPNVNNNNNNNNNKNNFDQYNDRMYNSFYNDYDQFSIKERRLLELASDTSNDNKITELYAMLDESGEYDGSYESYSKWLTIIGLVILLIPTLWCVLGTLMMLRKVIKACIDRHRRWKRLHSIPIVRYRRQPIDTTTNENSNENSIIISTQNDNNNNNNNNNDEINNGNDIIIEINLDDNKTDVIIESGTTNTNNSDSNVDNIDKNNDNSDNENTNGKSSKLQEKKGKQKQSDKYQSVDTIDEDIIDVNIDNNDNTNTNTNNNDSKNKNRIQNKFKHKTEMFTNRLINQANMLKNGDYYEKNQPLNSECVICLDDFKFNERIKLLPCFHGFHPHCIDPWLHTSSEFCPMCKQSIFNPETCQSKSSNSLSVNLNEIEIDNENENENSMDNVKHSQENINNMNNNDENNNKDNNNDNHDNNNNNNNNNNNEKTGIVSSVSNIIDQSDLNEMNMEHDSTIASSNHQHDKESIPNDEKINNENMITIDLNST